MKRAKTLGMGMAGMIVAVTLSGCASLVSQNVVAGLQDGAITTATGIIQGFFGTRFDLQGSDGGATTQGGSGNGLFITL